MTITHACSKLSAILALTALSGCSNNGAEPEMNMTESDDRWSSKDTPAGAEMPPRQEVSMGEHIDVEVDEQHLRTAAIAILHKAVDSTNPLLRANAIEALKDAPTVAGDAIRKGLGDENRGVRFTAAMIVGDLKLTEMRPLVEPLLLDESDSVQAAAIYAVQRCGGSPNLNPLSRMLLGEDPEAKGNAALVLGELGEPSAVSLLQHAIGRGMLKSSTARRKMVELQISEAMAKLGALQQLEVIRAALFSRPEEGEITALACLICGELRDEASLSVLLDLATRTGRQQKSAEIRMAAAMAASQINPQRAQLAVPTAYMTSERFELRAQAASTFGASGQPAALPYLMRLMEDANPLVQVSAAAGALRVQAVVSGRSGR